MNTVELKDLVGEHELSGVDTTIEGYWEYGENTNVVRFVLDGKTYKATENPDDGYRSYLDEIKVSDEKVSNNFPPQKVIGKMKENFRRDVKDKVIQFTDVITGKIVLEVGTDEAGHYYPLCVMRWNPENLAINTLVEVDVW